MAARVTEVYPEYEFGNFTAVDGTVRFYTRINAIVEPGDVVVDVGCGRGGRENDPCRYHCDLIRLKDRCAGVIGIDVDEAAAANPFVSEFRLIDDLARWPVDDASADVVVADYVLEHVEDPDAFFGEVARVLRPGGTFCGRTPNRRGYVATVSRLVPNRHHARVVGQAQVSREAEDVFPTFYRANTTGTLKRLFRAHGMHGVVMPAEGEPNYLLFSPLAYRLGAVAARAIPVPFRNSLMAFARKGGA